MTFLVEAFATSDSGSDGIVEPLSVQLRLKVPIAPQRLPYSQKNTLVQFKRANVLISIHGR